MSDLTPRQTEILRLIQRAIAETGMPPTRAEIANELGFKSPNAAEEHLRALARKGVIALVPGASRGIKLMDTMREQLGLPLIGRVAAGRPILAEENIESRLDIDPSIFQPRPHYLLKVVGMSMKDAGILDGDLVAVHRTPEVRNRQIIVARLDNEVTVKRYKQEGPVVWLMPENSDFEPIKVNIKEDPLIIEGVVVGVLREKDAEEILRQLKESLGGLATEYCFTQSNSPRAVPAEDLAEIAVDLGFGEENIHVAGKLDDALEWAVERAEADDEPAGGVLVTGSITLVADARILLGKADA